MFGSRDKRSVVVVLDAAITAAQKVPFWRVPHVKVELKRIEIRTGSAGGTATAVAFENWGTGGASALSTGGSVMNFATSGGTTWTAFQRRSGTSFTEATMSEGQVLAVNIDGLGTLAYPVIQVDYVIGGDF